MEYFVLSQDETIQHTVKIDRTWIPEKWRPARIIDRSIELKPADIPNKDQVYNFLVKSDKRNVYPDLLEIPLLLISEEMKDIFCSHERYLQCHCAMLSDREQRVQKIYWLSALERIECMGGGTEFYPNRFLKRLVLNQRKIGSRNIFRIQGILERMIIVNSDVVESILRRPMTGIKLEPVDAE